MARLFCYIILIQKELGIIFKIILLLQGRKEHFQQILLQRATAEGIQTVDLLIKQRIMEVAEVTNVQIIGSTVKDRQYQASVVIETIYGDITDTIRLEVG